MKTMKLNWNEVWTLIWDRLPRKGLLYGVPRGGAIVAGMTGRMVDDPAMADYIVDDIVDSGTTRARFKQEHPDKKFIALIDKTKAADRRTFGGWVQFPWETESSGGPEDAVIRILQHIGEDTKREGLRDTPKRVIKAWREMTVGYGQDPKAILGTDFEKNGYDQMIHVPTIEFVSCCEHHMLPFWGHAWVAYIPGHRVVGLSKVGRLVDAFARRLQIQERLTKQVSDAMHDVLRPKGVAVMVRAKHSCMCFRGVMKQDSQMVTTSLTGVFRQQKVREEFLLQCRNH